LAEPNRVDQELVSRIANGDQEALADAFRRFGGAVKALATRVMRDESLAEDVVQETFVWLWRSPERYDPVRGSLRTLLLTVAHRRAVDIVRSEEARARRESQPPDPVTRDVEDEVWARHLSDQVRSAIAELSSDERAAVSLAYLGGLSYVEVARQLEAPEGTVKSRIRSGLRRLATSLEGVSP
jgi:RNA polymerase sigma-70 factor, ECF subfamily